MRSLLRQPWFISLGLFVADLAFVSTAYFVSREVRISNQIDMSAAYLVQVAVFFACMLGAVALIGGYKARRSFRMLQFAAEFVLASSVGAAVGAFILFVFFSAGDFYTAQSRVVLLFTAVGYTVPALGLRLLVASIWTRRARRAPYLVIGSNHELANFSVHCESMGLQNPLVFVGMDLRPAGEIADDASPTHAPVTLDSVRGLEGIVLTDTPSNYPPGLLEKLARLHFHHVRVYNLATFFGDVWRKESVRRLDHSWAIRQDFQLARYSAYQYLKVGADYAIAILLLPIAVPLMLAVALAVLADSGFPVLYRQERVGRGEEPFTLLKFRTMRVREEEDDPYTRDRDARVTRVGRFLRLVRLDELPQIVNVLKGDMSFVGPRAEWSRIVSDYETKIPSYHLRHLVKPGITGWAQVNYRYGSGLDDAVEKLRYDLYYIKNYSLILDIEILLKTILKVCSFGGK